MTYTCIIVDDEDQTNHCETRITKVLKKKGLDIKTVIINPINPKFLDDNKINLDLKKVEKHIKTIIDTYEVVAIATDYDLSDPYINGLDIVRSCRNITRKIPIVLYSGNEEKVVRELLTSSVDDVQSIKELISLKIHTFINRAGYEEPIIKIIKNATINYTNNITGILREYGDYTYKGLPERFQNQELKKIANSIENNESYGFDFLEEISRQTIALIIDASSN